MDMNEIRAQLQLRVPEPMLRYGFYMAKGSFTKGPASLTSGLGKMLGGLKRKQSGGDMVGTSAGKAMFGLDNHQTALVITTSSLYAVDTTVPIGSREMVVGNVLNTWPLTELAVSGTARQQAKDLMLVSLDIQHPPTGQHGQLEAMVYTNLGDPTWDCYRALTGQ